MGALAVIIASLVWLVVAGQVGVSVRGNLEPGGLGVASVDDRGVTPDQLRLVTQQSIFTAGRPIEKQIANVIDAPETQLSLSITGLRTADPGSAILRLPNNRQVTIVEGDEILEGVELLEVYEDAILLRRNGVTERLNWDRPRAFLTAAPSTVSGDAPDSVGETAPALLSERQSQRLGALIGAMPLIPVLDDGRFIGFEVDADIQPLDLDKGDIIQRVNGTALGQVLDREALIATVIADGNLQLNVVREGDPITIDVPASALVGE